ncbi:MAG: NifB/NifX family molybdenum-iron cluster-binding protein [Candidatus Edwardsbacteria bacterium]|jgi:predicted Fe-Mo cluster-binding NifX family protein|nr:NifB/NifX family molybdenum-iron cluster-binding protein [Candidatus Edwardsbacteria bacterium]
MKLCIPAMTGDGPQATVCQHFGSAPFFIIADTASGAWEAVANGNEHHSHGMCHPLQSLQGIAIDAVVCAAIGAGAIGKLNSAGIRVFRASGAVVADVIAAGREGALAEMDAAGACSHHGCH